MNQTKAPVETGATGMGETTVGPATPTVQFITRQITLGGGRGRVTPASDAYLESVWLQDMFCAGCPGSSRVRGATGPYGEPLAPDEEICPSGYEIGGAGCIKIQAFEDVIDALAAADAAVEGARAWV